MLDPIADHVAYRTFADELGAVVFADPQTAAAQSDAVAAITGESGAAELGGLLHQLLAWAGSDGAAAELALIEQAAALWGRGVALCDRLAAIRADLEHVLENPSDAGSTATFDQAVYDVQVFGNDAIAIRDETTALRDAVLGFPHLPRHPRQADERTETWNWSDLTHGRRTEALVRNLHRVARDRGGDGLLAFAVGATAAYGAQVAGSAFLGHVVGGPRRSHRIRTRVAAMTVGAWLGNNHPAAAAPTALADHLASSLGSTLPPAIESCLLDGLALTFDQNRTRPVPDLNVGYQRLLARLRLLDQFVLPSGPLPPAPSFVAMLYGDPQNPPTSLKPQDVDVVGQDGGGVAVQMGPGEPSDSKPNKSDGNTVCGILVLLIILIDVIQAFVQCIVQWAGGHTCTFWENMLLKKVWEQDPPDPRDPSRPQTTSEQLVLIAGSPQSTELVAQLYDIHSQVWEALSRGRAFLAAAGLIYPSDVEGAPLYAQFTAVPPVRVWPMREEQAEYATYWRSPSGPLESPPSWPSPYQPGSSPAQPFTPGSLYSADVSLRLWRQIATDVQDSQNLDLDADRGDRHPCWAANGSVQVDPITVVNLAYSDQ